MCIEILFLAWAQIHFLDEVSFIFPLFFFYSVYLAFIRNSGPSFQIVFTAAERGSNFQEAQPSLQNTK